MWMFVVSVVGLIAWLVYRYGVFHTTSIYTDKLLRPHLLYYSYRGDDRSLGKQFEEIVEKTKDIFKLSPCFGIYYSLPTEAEWKCALGISVNKGQLDKIQSFLVNHSNWKHVELPTTRYVGATHPYVNFLSFILMRIRVYPKFFELIKKENYESFPGLMEIYHFSSDDKQIQLVNPLENIDQFQLYQEP